MIFIIPVIGLLCTTLVLFWLYPNQVKLGKLSDLYSADAVRTLASLNPKSLDYKLLAAGLKLRPVTFRLLCVAAGLAGLAVMWVFLPGLPAMVVGGIVFYVPNAWLDDKVKSRGTHDRPAAADCHRSHFGGAAGWRLGSGRAAAGGRVCWRWRRTTH